MRTVISHFYNEEYLLPWWLKHHVKLFDYGVMINHGSTDSSVEIIRKYAPHWRIVNSKLLEFDAFLTDFEVMEYELQLPPCWKIALTITEFLLPALPLELIEREVEKNNLTGISTIGYWGIDNEPDVNPSYDFPFPVQKHWGFNEIEKLNATGLSHPVMQRFYHKTPVGMYTPGRHRSYNPDSRFKANELLIYKLAYTPWNSEFQKRKTQAAIKVPASGLKFGFSNHLVRKLPELDSEYNSLLAHSTDLSKDRYFAQALRLAESNWF